LRKPCSLAGSTTREHHASLWRRWLAVWVWHSPRKRLDQRFTQAAAQFLRRMLEEAVKEVVTAHPVAIPLVQRFCGVYLNDALDHRASG
jgi:hypothetical protein